MKNRWEFYTPYEADFIQRMVSELRIPRPVARVFYGRNFRDQKLIREFLNPTTDQLHDPFLLKDLDIGVDRLILALREREKIMIYGDYDVDGITSTSLLYLFIKDMGGEPSFYIPDRTSEGYGISETGIDEAHKRGCTLIVTVDCGITSTNEVEYAAEHGIDVIISDHHEPAETLPKALAVIDPKRTDCLYPFKDLAGVGVAYKLTQGIVERLEMDSSFAEKYLDLVAIGSAADIVPLIGENRVFVRVGLEKLNRDGLEGIRTLVETAGYHPVKVDVGQIVYGLAPRINAVGRLGHASPAVELLITRDHHEALRIAEVLETENRRRKDIDMQTLDEALVKMDAEFDPDEDSVIVLSGEDWHSGVIGIVASRLIERYYRPTVMIAIENGVGKGSARSIPNFDLHSALKACSDLFEQFGGHKYAAGLTIKSERIPEFKERFNSIAKDLITDEDKIPCIKIDDESSFNEINADLIEMLSAMAPFGPKNSRPLFVSYGVQVVGNPRVVGRSHLKMNLRQDGIVFDAISFNRGEDLEHVRKNREIDVVYYLEENTWHNRTSIQLKVRDFK